MREPEDLHQTYSHTTGNWYMWLKKENDQREELMTSSWHTMLLCRSYFFRVHTYILMAVTLGHSFFVW